MNKSILILVIVLVFIAGTIVGLSDFVEAEKPSDKPVPSKALTIVSASTAQVGERFNVSARCPEGFALVNEYVVFNTFPAGHSGGSGGVSDSLGGNVERNVQVGWFLNLNNRDGVPQVGPVDGEVTILCIKVP